MLLPVNVSHAAPGLARRASTRSAAVLAAALTLLACGSADASAATTAHLPEADAYVSASEPTRNFGTGSGLLVDGSPSRVAYLRFQVGALSEPVVRATLQVYADKRSSSGFDVSSAASDGWSERTVTYSTRPAVSSTVVGRSGPYKVRELSASR